MDGQLPAYLTVSEVADLLRVSRATLDRLVVAGQFPPPIKFGGACQRFKRDELLAFLDSSKSADPMPARQRKVQRKRIALVKVR